MRDGESLSEALSPYGETVMAGLGGWELLIILVIVLLIFGVGRISRIGGELGQGIRAFREGMNEGKGEEKAEEAKEDESTDA